MVYRYSFAPKATFDEVEAALVLALVSTESLHGETQTRVDAAHFLDRTHRTCLIDASTAVGRDLNRLFAGYLRREFGENSFRVERTNRRPPPSSVVPAA